MTYNSSKTGAQVDGAVTDVQAAKAAGATDTTAGRLLKVGDFGVGGVGSTAGISDFLTVQPSGFYRGGGSGSANYPGSLTQYGSVLNLNRNNVNYRISVYDDEIFYSKINSDGTLDRHNELFHTGNTPITPNATTFIASPGGSEKMRVTADGDVLVGTTLDPNSLIQANTAVKGIGLRPAAGYIAVARDSDAATLFINKTAYTSGTTGILEARTDGAPVGGIHYDGTDVAIYQFSDARLKENITDHESELNNVMSLRPVRFDWRDGHGPGEGFIAQELEETAWADLVSEGDDGFKQVSGLGRVNTRLIKAIQEQQQLIESLTARIEALENKQ